MSAESEIKSETPMERLEVMPCAQCRTSLDTSALEPFAGVQCPKCGNQDTVPARFGEFLLLNLINTGGMGQVFRGRDESLGRLVAIKVMLRKLGEDAEFVENFRREAQAAARLNHPNIAQIYSYGQVSGQPYIVMELVSGQRFDKLIDSHPGGLDPAEVMRIGLEIAEGLQAADEIGLVHGDIKPENILLDEKRKAKLVDFGIASYADQAALAGIWGTPYYIAPEKASGRKSDARSDIYSLGATLYHALAGKPPFEGATPVAVVKARLARDPVPLKRVRPALPKSGTQTVARMLQRKGSGLPLSARPSAPRLGGKLLPKAGERRAAAVAERKKGNKTLAVVLGLILVVCGSAIWFANQRARTQKEHAARAAYELKLAVGRTATLYTAIQVTATNALLGIAQFDPIAARARAVVTNLEALTAAMPEPKLAVAVAPEPAATPAESVVAPIVPAEPDAASVDEAGREAPIGISNRKVVESARPRKQPKPGPKSSAPTRAAGPAAPTSPVSPVQALAEQVAQLAMAAHAEATNIASSLQAAELLRDGAAQATSTNEVNVKVFEMESQRAQLEAVAAGLTNRLQQAAALTVQIETLGRDACAVLEQRRAEVQRGVDERARQATLAAELAAAAERESQADQLGGNGKYAEALSQARSGQAEIKSEEVRARLQRLVDRYERLETLRKFLIDSLNQEPFRWGWERSGDSGEDVLGADAKGVKLKDREVPWTSVSGPQVLKFIDHYVGDPKLRRSAQGEQYLAAAIFCEINGQPERGRGYRAKAVAAVPSLEAEAKRLLATEP